MRRVFLHTAFWLAYIAQDVLLQFTYMETYLRGIPFISQVIMAIKAASIIVIPKLLVTYYLLCITVKEILNDKKKLIWPAIKIVVVFAAGIVLFRGLYFYYINPYVFLGKEHQPPLFSIQNIFVALLEIGFIAAVAVIIKFVRIHLASMKKEKSLVREKLETELKFIRSQTNPHFLFNTLNNIYALARKKSDDTADVVMKLSKLLRFMLYETTNKQIKISDELKILDDYLELEKLRYNGRLTISFLREIDNDSEQIAPLLLIPLVENAFKHGASESRFLSFIHLDIKLQDHILIFNIENTKEPTAKKLASENIGLTSVRRQLELMYGEHDVVVQNEATLFKVFLKINLGSYASI